MIKSNTKQKSVWPELAAVFISIAFTGLLARSVLDLIHTGFTSSIDITAAILNTVVYITLLWVLLKFYFMPKNIEKIILTIAIINFSAYYVTIGFAVYSEIIYTFVYYFFNYKFIGGQK